MQIEDWRRARGLTYAKLGELIGVRTEGARRLCLPHGAPWRNNPTIPQLVKIMEITDGAVQAHDFLPQNCAPSLAPGGTGALASDAGPAAPRRGSAGRPLTVTSAAGRKAAETRKRRKAAGAEVGA